MAEHIVTSGLKLDPAKGYAFLRAEHQLWLLAAGCLVLVAAGAWCASGALVEEEGAYTVPLGWSLIAFGGWIVVRLLRVILTLPRRVVVLTSDGFHDARVTKHPVSWPNITRAELRKPSLVSVKGVQLWVKKDALRDAGANRLNQQTGSFLTIPKGINATLDELHDAVYAYWQAHSPYAREASQ